MRQSTAEKYIDDALSGKILVSKLVRLQLERHQNDLKTAHERGLVFNRRKAQFVIEFFHRFLVQTDDTQAGQPFRLLPFQQAMLWIYYGWQHRDTGFRRYKTAYVEVARGNGKSGLLSGIGVLELVTGAPGTEVYSAATDKDSAKIVFGTSDAMVRMSPALSSRISRYRNNLSIPARGSKYEPLSSKDQNLQGKRVSLAILDELHSHPTRGVWDALVNALGKRDNSRIWAITTAGSDRHSICWEQHEYSEKVLTGVIPDDSWFAWIAALDPEDVDNWEDESLWIKANPALGTLVKLQDMREQALKAKNDPASLNSFLRYRLNIWTQSHTVWLPPDKWERCSDSIDRKKLASRPCFGGLDLATINDIAAFVLLFPPYGDDPLWRVLPEFFLPEDNIEARVKRDRVPYDVWARQGLFNLTPGNVIDYDFIRNKINELFQLYDIREIAYDHWNSQQIVTQLTGDGLEMVKFGQGFASMSAPSKRLMELVLSEQIAHGGNPILRWMAGNVMAATDPAGNIKPDKGKSREKIDGIVALIMALGRAATTDITGPTCDVCGVWSV